MPEGSREPAACTKGPGELPRDRGAATDSGGVDTNATEISELYAVAIELIVVGLIARRSIALARGVPYSPVRLALAPVVVLALWAITELEALAWLKGDGPYLLAADAAIVLATTWMIAPMAARQTTISESPQGGRTVRLGMALAAGFFVVFLARIVVVLVLLPASLEFGAPPSGGLTSVQQVVLAGIDALLSLSVGLLLARSLGIVRRARTFVPSP